MRNVFWSFAVSLVSAVTFGTICASRATIGGGDYSQPLQTGMYGDFVTN